MFQKGGLTQSLCPEMQVPRGKFGLCVSVPVTPCTVRRSLSLLGTTRRITAFYLKMFKQENGKVLREKVQKIYDKQVSECVKGIERLLERVDRLQVCLFSVLAQILQGRYNPRGDIAPWGGSFTSIFLIPKQQVEVREYFSKNNA